MKEKVTVDKYAVYNKCLEVGIANYKELCKKMGMSSSYLSTIFRVYGGEMSLEGYNKMRGVLGVTDDSLIKAVPCERANKQEHVEAKKETLKDWFENKASELGVSAKKLSAIMRVIYEEDM